jgi:predicted glycosyltransferase
MTHRARIMCHVQHLMGSGHQWRTAAVSRALGAHDFDVTYVSGGYALPGLDVGCARFVQLPPARAADMRYRVLVDEHGEPVDDAWRARRRALLLDSFERCRPDLLLIETFPFGRRLLRFELLPLLEAAWARRPRPRIVCSVRDILENHQRPERDQEIVDLIGRYFDLVLVHSDPTLVPFEVTFPLTDRIAHKLRYTGYVMAHADAVAVGTAGRDEVVVSAGGAAFGEHVLAAAIEARALSALNKKTWRILVGHNLPHARFKALQTRATEGLVIERNRKDFMVVLRNCAVSVSQGGYNTTLEVLDAGARAVIVPYADEREKEQAVRARLLRGHGLVEVVEDQELTPAGLAQAVDAAYRRQPGRGRPVINTDGAAATARLLAEQHHFGERGEHEHISLFV